MRGGLEMLQSGVQDRLDAMLARANAIPQFLERNVKRRYLSAQAKRWMTQNSGEEFDGGEWSPLSQPYENDKLYLNADDPGKGGKMMIATGRLVDSVLGRSGDYREVLGSKSLFISTVVPYAYFVSEDTHTPRTITKFSKAFYATIGQDLQKFVAAKMAL